MGSAIIRLGALSELRGRVALDLHGRLGGLKSYK